MRLGYIYKITSPSKKIYIGQTVDLKERIRKYKYCMCNKQRKLYYSLKKHGWDKHKFEVLTECNPDDLNKQERYYQDLYSACGKNGMNLVFTDSGARRAEASQETRNKISETRKNMILSDTHKENLRLAGEKRRGIKRPQWVIDKIKKTTTGIKKGKMSEEGRLKQTAGRAEKRANRSFIQIINASQRLLFNVDTGIYYYSVQEASFAISKGKCTLTQWLSGKKPNKSSIIIA